MFSCESVFLIKAQPFFSRDLCHQKNAKNRGSTQLQLLFVEVLLGQVEAEAGAWSRAAHRARAHS